MEFFKKNPPLKSEKKEVGKIFVGIGLFLIIVLPMSAINIENTGTDGLITPLIRYGPGYISDYQNDEYLGDINSENIILELVRNCIENTGRYQGD